MIQFTVFSILLAAAAAAPGNLGIGYGVALGGAAGAGGYGGIGGYRTVGGYGAGPSSTANQVSVAVGATPVAVPVVAAVPQAHVAVVPAPVATSTQSRFDIVQPTQVFTRVAAAVPVATVAVGGYGAEAGLGAGVGAGYGVGYGAGIGAGGLGGYGVYGGAGGYGGVGRLGGYGYGREY